VDGSSSPLMVDAHGHLAAGIDSSDPRFRVFREHAQRYSADPRIQNIARELCSIGKLPRRGDQALAQLSAQGVHSEMASRLLRGVQQRVRFTGPLEAFRNPIDTWRDGWGDCKGSSALLAALALSVGCNATLMAMGRDNDPSHVCAMLQPYDGAPWLWAETTIPGAALGEHPVDAFNRLRPGGAREDLGATSSSSSSSAIGDPAPSVHVAARTVINAAFQAELGRTPTPFEAQLVGAICYLETSYGQGWTGAGVGSHNWGAIQARAGQSPSFMTTDSYPDGTRYSQAFKSYPDDVAGARDVVHFLYVSMPAVGAALKAGKSVTDVATAMYRSHYFGGYCPKALAQYGADARTAEAFTSTPATSVGGKACEAESIAGYANTLSHWANAIASANGESPPALGSSSSSSTPWIVLGVVVIAVGGGYYLYRRKKRPGGSRRVPLDEYQPEEEPYL
jgi:LPXTG-motif cell wall-anchored protein